MVGSGSVGYGAMVGSGSVGYSFWSAVVPTKHGIPLLHACCTSHHTCSSLRVSGSLCESDLCGVGRTCTVKTASATVSTFYQRTVRSGPRQLLAGAAQGVRVAALEVGVFNAAEELAEPTRCQGLLTVAR